MVYKFEEKIVNRNNVNNFYDKNNFVGYILPNGEIYSCKEHNVSNIKTILFLFIELLVKNFQDKDKFLIDTDDKLLKIIFNYLKNVSYDEIIALNDFIHQNNLFTSDLIVQLFGCHLVTRLDKTILTSETNHECFFNYLLNNFTVYNIDKIVYDKNLKQYKYVKTSNTNKSVYDEIDEIKTYVAENSKKLFYKER